MAKKVVIAGGGFAGFNLAKNLGNTNYEVVLIDRDNYIFFPPLLYQVATGFLEPSSISYPYRKMLRNMPNIHFKMGEIVRILPDQNIIELNIGKIDYDYLVLATGTETNYFGLENVRKNAIPMKTINDALDMRNYILKQLESATTFLHDKEKLKRTLSIVIAGGGPTGVEISGMLAEMKASVLRKDYPEFNNTGVRGDIYLVDGLPQLLSPMSKKSQENTYNSLKKLGVNIILNSQVKDYTDGKVILSNGQIIETDNLIWTAGVIAQKFEGLPDSYYGRGNRLICDEFNKVKGTENIYAIGDTCLQTHEAKFAHGHPQVAQVALQQGKNMSLNFKRMSGQKPIKAFEYNDKGSMAIIGRNKAVVDIPPGIHFKGFVAWFIWIFIHLVSLVHYRNKITTLYNWVGSYFTKDQALRMLIRPVRKQ
ncbi:MAG: NAD(P)/FAD-dependent oxidoreductase [Bacteroidia bacterium]|nr:NAD(P)/FAD-dependent oxidoreductase [Bacteroidia bacterium]MCZ2247930.1 NAD(P)/FAD-dependent oxidoreductase [Bacteroidia bacterium]